MTSTEQHQPVHADQSSELQRAKEMGAFADRLHARRNLPLGELAQHVVASAPPEGYHTGRIVNVDGSDEKVIASIDLQAGHLRGPVLVPHEPMGSGAHVAKWRLLTTRPTVRPGVVDINMSIAG